MQNFKFSSVLFIFTKTCIIIIIGAIAESAAKSVWPFHIYHLNCSGFESVYQDCDTPDLDTCASNQDAFLFCQGMTSDMPRLTYILKQILIL